MTGKSRPEGGSQTPATASADIVPQLDITAEFFQLRRAVIRTVKAVVVDGCRGQAVDTASLLVELDRYRAALDFIESGLRYGDGGAS